MVIEVNFKTIIVFVALIAAFATLAFFIGRDIGNGDFGGFGLKKKGNKCILKTPSTIKLTELLELLGKCYKMENAHFECFHYGGGEGERDIVAVQYVENDEQEETDPNDAKNRVLTLIDRRIVQMGIGMMASENSMTAVIPMIVKAEVDVDMDFTEVE